MAKHFQNVATHHQQRYLDLTRAIDENRQRMNARNAGGEAQKAAAVQARADVSSAMRPNELFDKDHVAYLLRRLA
jgi:hypothetical protein